MPEPLKLGVAVGRGVDAATSISVARRAEELGFASVWVSEDYFLRGAFAVAGGVAAVTERVAVGVGVVNPYSRHPALVAMEAAALDELSEGRAIVGLGASIKPWVQDQMGIPYRRPLSRLGEAVGVVRGLVRGETVDHDGTFAVHGVRLGFSPRRRDLPVWVGAMGDKGLRLAGELADGLLLSVLASPGYVRFALERARAGAAAAGCTDLSIPIAAYLPFSLSSDADRARAGVKPFLAQMLRLLGGDEPLVQHSELDPDELARTRERLASGESPADAVSDRVVGALTVAGDGPGCRARLEEYAAAGLGQAVLFGVGDVLLGQLVGDAAAHLDLTASHA